MCTGTGPVPQSNASLSKGNFMSESEDCGCNESNEDCYRIEDEEVVFQIRRIPISLKSCLVIIQFKDREILAESVLPDSILVEEGGILTLTLHESAEKRKPLSSFFSGKTLTAPAGRAWHLT